MKHLLIIILLFTGAGASAQPYWQPVASGTTHKLLCIDFGNISTGYIGGADSLLLKTVDGGQTWSRLDLMGISFLPAINGRADDITDVNFVSDQIGYITVSSYENPLYQGVVYKTTNGGLSWTPLDAGNTAAARSFFFSDGAGFVIGSAFFSGYVISRINGDAPADYHYFSASPVQFLQAVDFRNSQTGIVAGDGGLVCRTFDGGATWDTVRANTDSAIYAVKFLDDHTVMAATNNMGATLLISTDTGRTWEVETSSLTFFYPVMKGLAFSAKDSFIAVGASGNLDGKGVIYWHDHMFNRFEQVDEPMYGVAMKNDTVAFAVGDHGLILTNHPETGTGIASPALPALSLRVYPNPASGHFISELPLAHTVTVYDIAGKSVWRNEQPMQKQHIELGGLPAGTYLVEASAGGRKGYSKIVLR